MKLILVNDLHLTSKLPRHRTGSITNDSNSKVDFIFSLAEEHNASIISGGDVFNTPRDIFALFGLLKISAKYSSVKLYSVFGQHDFYMRNKEVLSNLSILASANVITVLSSKPINIGGVALYGSSWGEDIPIIEDKEKFNVLAIHKSIYHKPIFPGQILAMPNSFLMKYDFDLVVSGDIHRHFITSIENRYLTNSGPLLRLDHTSYNLNNKPRVYLFDTDSRTIETILVPCRDNPFDERFIVDYDASVNVFDADTMALIKSRTIGKSIDDIISSIVLRHENKANIRTILAEIKANEYGID